MARPTFQRIGRQKVQVEESDPKDLKERGGNLIGSVGQASSIYQQGKEGEIPRSRRKERVKGPNAAKGQKKRSRRGER